ncbi:MAG: hypothetical protein EOP54_25610, partial [Sphingobacteriales bacterium]
MRRLSTYILIAIVALIAACNKESDGNKVDPNKPSNIQINATPSTDNSGDVTFAVTATNAVSYEFDFGNGRPFSQGRHTIFENINDSQRSVRGVINARTYATVNITKDLKATTNVSFDLQDIHERLYDNPIVGDGAPAGRAYQYLYRTTNITFNQLLEYNK